MPKRIDQVLAGFAEGDAISHEALILRDILRGWGVKSDLYVDTAHLDPAMRGECLPISDMRHESSDALIHHYSIASPAVTAFMSSSAKKIILYHNITPARYFEGFDDRVAGQLVRARDGIAALVPKVDAMWAVSKFNASELEAFGAKNVKVFPLLFSKGRFDIEPEPRVAKSLSGPLKNILFVGRISPNKRVEDLIAAFAWYCHTINFKCRLLIAGSERSCPRYYTMLRMFAMELDLPEVCFQHFVSPAGLVAHYNAADVFVTTSEHEGFCLPLVEAMHRDVPVIARKVGGIPEALGGAGIMYEDASPRELAALIDRVISDQGMRSEVIESQRRRMAEINSRKPEEELKSLLAGIL